MFRYFLLALSSSILLAQPGIISTFMGNGVGPALGCSGPATSVGLLGPAASVTADASGTLYVYDGDGHICKVTPGGAASTLANAPMQGPIAPDAQGNLYYATGGFIGRFAPGGAPTFIAGSFNLGYSGDGGPATAATLNPTGVVFEQSTGRLYIADTLNHRIRMIAPNGIITTIAGTGVQGFSGDGGLATSAQLSLPQGMAMDKAGNLYFCALERVRKINTNTGIITTVAGNGSVLGLGENVPATSTGLGGPTYVAVDAAGILHISETGVNRIRRVNAQGLISTIAGQGIPGFAGDGGPATAASMFGPSSITIDGSGNIYFVDQFNRRIRKINGSPSIGVSPGELTFSSQNGSTPPAQTVNVTTTGNAELFTVTVATASGGNWLSATPLSGTLPANLTITANPAGLPIGSYTGTVTITAAGMSNSPKVIPVTLNVSGASVPNITAVVNALGYQPKLAPGVVFTIFGTFLGPAVLTSAPAPNYPLSLSTTSVRFAPAGGGAATSAPIIYTSSGQVAGHLPSSVAPGVYQVRLTYLGATSDPFTVTVVARSLGIATANSAGTGPAQATIATVNGGFSLIRETEGSLNFGGFTWRLTPAHGGDIIVFWGTGGGADLLNDTGGTSGNQATAGNFTVSVGGRSITPQYAGTSSGFPGLWQVNVPLPSDITTGCAVPVVITGGAEPSNAVTIAIARSGQTTCGL